MPAGVRTIECSLLQSTLLNPFTKSSLRWVIGLAVPSFLVALAYSIYSPQLAEIGSQGADAFSVSAVGLKGVVELLDELDVPVLLSRRRSAERSGEDSLLFVASPSIDFLDREGGDVLEALRRHPFSAVLFLPKYGWGPSAEEPRHVGSVRLLEIAEVEDILKRVGLADATVVRPSGDSDEQSWETGELGAEPSIRRVQLIRSDGLTPIVSSQAGMLVGRGTTEGGGDFTIVSDPDVVMNHGLFQGQNALLAVRVIELARPDEGVVVFDQATHGHVLEPTLWSELFKFPLVVATTQALLLIAIVLWATVRRFGAPVKEQQSLVPGKEFLIQNTAELLDFLGEPSDTVRRYFWITSRHVSESLAAPATADDAEAADWLDAATELRGLGGMFRELRSEVLSKKPGKTGARRTLHLAKRIYLWREEMLNGSESSQRTRRAA